MASENFNNNTNKHLFPDICMKNNNLNHLGERLNEDSKSKVGYENSRGTEYNNSNLNNFSATNTLLNKFENCANNDFSEANFRNQNTINNKPNFQMINDNQVKNLNNTFNVNSSNFNNTMLNKSTNSNTRFSFDNHENSNNIIIENQLSNSNFNDSAENNEIYFSKNQNYPGSKRNHTLNPSILRGLNNKNDFHNSMIYRNQIDIIPEILSQPHTNLTETKNKNLILKAEAENSICHSCHGLVEDNEIVYFCSCERIFHFSCLSEFMSKHGRTIHNPCNDCGKKFKIFYFKLIQKDEEEENPIAYYSTENEKGNGMGKTVLNGNSTINFNNSSLADTNINNLDNYEFICGLAMQMNHESMCELISKSDINKNISKNATPCSIGRIPLSPIPLNSTPYAGKGKTKNVSNLNENSENINYNEGIDVSPNGINNFSVNNINNFNNSPFESLHTIKKQFDFNSPSERFDLIAKYGNIEERENRENPLIHNIPNEEMSNIKMNLNDNKYSDIMNVSNSSYAYSKIENNLNSAKNINLFNSFGNEYSSNNDEKAIKECNYLNNSNAAFISNVKTSVPKKSNDNSAINNQTFINNQNHCNNLYLNETNYSKINRVPLGNSVLHNNNFNNDGSINLNNTPDNKKNKFEFMNDGKSLNVTGRDYKGYSFSELQYMDKENNPPIPKESSRFSNLNETSSPLEINIELGISHLNSDQYSQRTLEIPVTVSTKYCYEEKENVKNDAEVPLIKEYLIIFNILSLNLSHISEFLRIAANKMNNDDKLYSNVFSKETWLSKGDLEYLLDLENNLPFFQNVNYLNSEGIIQAIDYCVEISLENNSNIFSVIIVNELTDLYSFNNNNVKEDLHKIANKLKEKRVLMVKNFSINTIMLNPASNYGMNIEEKVSSELEKLKFISFLNQLSNLTMGSNFVVKDWDEFLRSTNLLFSSFDNIILFNLRAVIKGNKDPSLFLDCFNYPNYKSEHNKLEIFLGNLMKNETKSLNLGGKIILNNLSMQMNIPLFEVHFEYIKPNVKKESSIFGNYRNSSNFKNKNHYSGLKQNLTLMKKETSAYSINIPILRIPKQIEISSNVLVKNTCARIADLIHRACENIKDSSNGEAYSNLKTGEYILEKTLLCISNSEIVDYQSKSNNFLSISVLNLLETNNYLSTQEKNEQENLQNLSLFNYSLENFVKDNRGEINYNQNFTHLPNKNNFQTINTYDNSKKFNDLNVTDIENINDLFLMQFGIEDENISLIKYVAKDLKNLMRILENNEVEKNYKFFVSCESLSYQRAVDIEDERFLSTMLD